MNRSPEKSLQLGRALWTFVVAYVAITIVATIFSIALEQAMHVAAGPPMESPAYRMAERFFPVMNLLVWIPVAALYFKGRGRLEDTREAKLLGAFWLVLAIVVDFVGFVLIKNPISLVASRLLHRAISVDLPHLPGRVRKSEVLRCPATEIRLDISGQFVRIWHKGRPRVTSP